jgi:hypothetical protein
VRLVRASLLKVLVRVEGEVRFEDLCRLVGLSRSTIRRYLRELLGEGLLTEVSSGVYVLTDRGRRVKELLQRTLSEVGSDRAYLVTDPGAGAPIPLKIRSLKQLYAVIKYGLAPEEVLREHLRRGYISAWVRDVLGDEVLAAKLRTDDLGEATRVIEELISLVE